jgi:GlpG protein
MRQIGTIPQETQARRFSAYLLTKGIKSTVELDEGKWKIWVREEDQLQSASEELQGFLKDPTADEYRGVETKAEKLLREEANRAIKSKRNVVEMRSNWSNASRRTRPLTIVLMLICIVVAILSGSIGMSEQSGPQHVGWVERALKFRDPGDGLPDSFNPPQLTTARVQLTFSSISNGEFWRLITPIFLHADLWHLVFNLFVLYHFGTQIESVYGTWKFASLVFAIALVSNLLQATFVGSNFVGISGVGFGLFGFAWIVSILDPKRGIYVPQLTVFILLGWFVIGATGLLEQGDNPMYIANWAHGGGLFCGLMLGYIPIWLRKTMSKK